MEKLISGYIYLEVAHGQVETDVVIDCFVAGLGVSFRIDLFKAVDVAGDSCYLEVGT